MGTGLPGATKGDWACGVRTRGQRRYQSAVGH